MKGIDTKFDIHDIVAADDGQGGSDLGEIREIRLIDDGDISERYLVKFEHVTEDLPPESLTLHVCYLCGKPMGTIQKPYCHSACGLAEARRDDMSLEGQEFDEEVENES